MRNGPDILERRLKHWESFGLPEDKIKELLRRFPRALSVSIDKVQKTIEFFIHTVGLPAKFVLAYPLVLSCSLERKIKPCHKLLKSLSVMQPSKSLPSLCYVVCLTEKRFLEEFVKCSPHATKFLEIYSGKLVDLDNIH